MNISHTLEALENYGYEKLYLEALNYALNLIRFKYRVKNIGDAQEIAEEVLQETITKICEGERNWTSKEYSIKSFFFGVVKSVTSNYFALAFQSKRAIAEIKGEHSNELGNTLVLVPKTEITPEDLLIGEDLEEKIIDVLCDDEALLEFYLLKQEGFKNQAIALKLGVSVRDVENIRKRCLRKLQKILDD